MALAVLERKDHHVFFDARRRRGMPVSGFPARRTRLRAGFQQSAGAAALAGAGALFSDGEIVTGVVVSRGVIMPIVDMRIAFGRVRRSMIR
jgi:hypothetical protein